MTKKDLKDWIKENANPKAAEFAASLIPNLKHKIYGVSLPLLRKKAKELTDDFTTISDTSCEEILLKGFAIGYIKDIQKQIPYIKSFVSQIDNWMVCDSFCSALRNAKKDPQTFFALVSEYAQSSNDYEQRFAYVMLLKHFCNPEYIERTVNILTQASPQIWDTKQAVAWALTECFIKFPVQTSSFLAYLQPEIFNLTKRKILDSKRVSDEIKQHLRNENHVLLCE